MWRQQRVALVSSSAQRFESAVIQIDGPLDRSPRVSGASVRLPFPARAKLSPLRIESVRLSQATRLSAQVTWLLTLWKKLRRNQRGAKVDRRSESLRLKEGESEIDEKRTSGSNNGRRVKHEDESERSGE